MIFKSWDKYFKFERKFSSNFTATKLMGGSEDSESGISRQLALAEF